MATELQNLEAYQAEEFVVTHWGDDPIALEFTPLEVPGEDPDFDPYEDAPL